MKSRGFTLIELIVVVGIFLLLITFLTPVLTSSLGLGRATRCATNIRNIEIAHMSYMRANYGGMVNAGLSHGYPSEGKEQDAWINTLRKYYGTELVARSPVDTSPHWGPAPEGSRIPGAPMNQRRRTSYGINNMLTDMDGDGYNPFGRPPRGFRNWPGGDGGAYTNMTRVPRPSETVHVLIMAYRGPFAGADHPHVEQWYAHPKPEVAASRQVQINAHGGDLDSPSAVSNWGYLDGHVETLSFSEVFQGRKANHFIPHTLE